MKPSRTLAPVVVASDLLRLDCHLCWQAAIYSLYPTLLCTPVCVQFGDLHPRMGLALTLLTLTFISNVRPPACDAMNTPVHASTHARPHSPSGDNRGLSCLR